jgi:hypothetical protein
MPVVEQGRFDELFILLGPVLDIRSDGQRGSRSALLGLGRSELPFPNIIHGIESGYTRGVSDGQVA